MEAILALEDGRVFKGRAFGAHVEKGGEVVFNTSMCGYQEILTDPSYAGQIVVMTYPEIGNYGTNALDPESESPQVEAMVVREVTGIPSNWRATQDLHLYLNEHGIPGISEVDTRALTRHIRTRGALRGMLSCVDRNAESLIRKAKRIPPLGDVDLVASVTTEARHRWEHGRDPRWAPPVQRKAEGEILHCVAYDFGAKRNILRILRESGFEVTVVPADFPAEEALQLGPDAVFLSNGPGDPAVPSYAVTTVGRLIGRIPMFGICLGHQIAALALGAKTFKLKFGHRGANHPVKDLRTGKVEVTSQNHGYAVDPERLPSEARVTHLSLNDGTCEGFVVPEKKLLAVQYHPESSPGPHDSIHLFREFRAMAASPEESVPAFSEVRR